MIEEANSKPKRGSIIGLALSAYGAGVIALLTSMVLTRAMSAEDFGSYRYIVTVIGFSAVVANLGFPYSAARVLTSLEPSKQARTVAASMQLLALSILFFSIFLAIFAVLSRTFLSISSLLIAASFLIWTTTFQRHYEYMLRGVGRAREIAFQKLGPPTLILILSIIVLIWSTDISLIYILLIIGVAYFSTHLVTASRLRIWRTKCLSDERAGLMVVQKTVGFPIYKGALISVGAAELVLVLGGAYVGKLDYGSFALAISLAAPVATLPSAIAMVQFRRFGIEGRLRRKVLYSTVLYSFTVGFVTVCVGWLVFPILFPIQFTDAKIFFPVLAIGFLFHGLADYINQFLQAQGMGNGIKLGSYIVGATNIVVAISTIPFLGIWGLVATKVAGSVFYAIVMFVLMRRRNREVR